MKYGNESRMTTSRYDSINWPGLFEHVPTGLSDGRNLTEHRYLSGSSTALFKTASKSDETSCQEARTSRFYFTISGAIRTVFSSSWQTRVKNFERSSKFRDGNIYGTFLRRYLTKLYRIGPINNNHPSTLSSLLLYEVEERFLFSEKAHHCMGCKWPISKNVTAKRCGKLSLA